MTEIEFEQSIVDLARVFGWRAVGFRPARTGKGWRTPVKYDGKGWPDLTLTHESGVVIFAEIKGERGTPEPDQVAWSEHLTAIAFASQSTRWDSHRNLEIDLEPIRYRLWYPRDRDAVAVELSFGRVTRW